MLTQTGGTPVLVRDVAQVEVGNKPRLGIAGRDNQDDIVQGIILMRRGEKSMPTIRRVEAEIERINQSNVLPPGVHIERIYDRKDLIEVTTRTVLHNMVFGITLIFILQWCFLGNLRSALIVGATIPFALFFAVGIIVLRGNSANLCRSARSTSASSSTPPSSWWKAFSGGSGRNGKARCPVAARQRPRRQADRQAGGDPAGGELRQPLDFLCRRHHHRRLHPAVHARRRRGPHLRADGAHLAYALAGGLLATFTVAPALSAYLLPEHTTEVETILVRALHRVYSPALRLAVANKKATLAGAVVLLVVALLSVKMLGLEFLPKLEEGNLWIRATMPSTISLGEGNDYVNRMRTTLAAFPEVESIVSQHGRPDDGTDATGFFNAFFAPLKPVSEWPPGVDKESLTEAMLKKLQDDFPGVEFNFSQYLQDNVAEAVSGVKGENSIKLYGNNLQDLTDTANRIKEVLSTVRGITDLSVFTSLGQPTLQIDIDREGRALRPHPRRHQRHRARRHRRRFGRRPVRTGQRPALPHRGAVGVAVPAEPRLDQNLAVGVQSQQGFSQVPLSEIANIEIVSGAAYIYREMQQRYLPIKFSVRDRDLGSAIKEAQKKVVADVPLPPGSRLEWVGEFGNLQDAIARLQVVVPISLALIARCSGSTSARCPTCCWR